MTALRQSFQAHDPCFSDFSAGDKGLVGSQVKSANFLYVHKSWKITMHPDSYCIFSVSWFYVSYFNNENSKEKTKIYIYMSFVSTVMCDTGCY